MPGFVAEAGLADQVLPLEQIASELVSRVRRGSTMIRQPSRSILTMRSF
jgi:chemotaxis response regulator CheB